MYADSGTVKWLVGQGRTALHDRRLRHGTRADVVDLIAIGGGVMGLFTAYQSQIGSGSGKVVVRERGSIGYPAVDRRREPHRH